MKRQADRIKGTTLPANRIILRELEEYLRSAKIRQVHFGDGSTPPPALAYVTNFPRLSVPLSGCHTMEIARSGRVDTIQPVRGHAVFIPDHAWNKPDWSAHVEALTVLFGAKQIGISLVRHQGDTQSPSTALKTSVQGGYDVPTHSILAALMVLAADHVKGPLTRLLTESLLHACLRLLKSPHQHPPRKAIRTYESLCLYVQENFQSQITRESVAHHFGLAPNHISRLFRKEGFMRFNDYLNLVRVNRAKFMLQTYSLTLKEIAFDCGYNDTAYFCRVFKKTCKITPTQYRAASTPGK
ncbi:MAG TPA: helix-turn-helix transcriptional regulator [Candidatus Acidoferrum sp.]|nr:helix-turn-helix transcriptional regulator [Candidatus Acidoferrum sp.]